MDRDFLEKVTPLLQREPRYTAEAYDFVSRALEYAESQLPERRHMQAMELVEFLRQFAVEEYGAVAAPVLHKFGLKTVIDVGNAVYAMIGIGMLSASAEDSQEEFNCDEPLIPPFPVIRQVRRKSDVLPVLDEPEEE